MLLDIERFTRGFTGGKRNGIPESPPDDDFTWLRKISMLIRDDRKSTSRKIVTKEMIDANLQKVREPSK